MKMLMRCGLASVGLLTDAAPMTFPPELKAADGEIVLEMAPLKIADPVTGSELYTRAWNGQIPGPTIRVSPGQSISMKVVNTLIPPDPDCGMTKQHYCYPNTTNVHTHGLHVSPAPGSDDIFLAVQPNQTSMLRFDLGDDHMGGTHWYHPHHHHGTALQAGGGAAGVIIVEDPPGSIPPELANMEDRILFINVLNFTTMIDLARKAGDNLWQSNATSSVIMTNGQVIPELHVDADAWYRFRMVFSSIEELLQMQPRSSDGGSCVMQLVALDGMYLMQAPRRIDWIDMAPGNRADVAVRCGCKPVSGNSCSVAFESAGKWEGSGSSMQIFNGVVFTLNVSASQSSTGDGMVGQAADDNFLALGRQTFAVRRPCYASDLRDVTADEKHEIVMGGAGGVFRVIWDGSGEPMLSTSPMPDALAAIPVGSIQEWTVKGIRLHPFHVHTFPYQIQAIGTETGMRRRGDWLDTVHSPSDLTTVRLVAEKYTGKALIHCHQLEHEDQGMMAYLNVSGQEGAVSERLGSSCYRSSGGVRFTYYKLVEASESEVIADVDHAGAGAQGSRTAFLGPK